MLRSLVVLWAAVAAIGTQIGFTQEPAEEPPELAPLSRFVGTWVLESKRDGETIEQEVTVKRVAEGQSLRWNGQGKNLSTGETHSGSGLIGYDPLADKIVERGFMSDGSTFTSVFETTSGERWKNPITRTGKLDNGEWVEETAVRYFRWKSDDEFVMTRTDRKLDGKPAPDITVHCRRKGVEEAERLRSYFRFFEGEWDVSGPDGSSGKLTITPAANGRCHKLRYKLGDAVSSEICGYDPATGKWTCRGFSTDGGRYAYRMEGVPDRAEAKAGDRFVGRQSGVTIDGMPVSARYQFSIVSPDSYTLDAVEQTVAGAEQPDESIRMSRAR